MHAQMCVVRCCATFGCRDRSNTPRCMHSSHLPACVSAPSTTSAKQQPLAHIGPPAHRRLRIPPLLSGRRRTSSRDGVRLPSLASTSTSACAQPRLGPGSQRRPRPAPPVRALPAGRPQRPRARPQRHGRHEQVPAARQGAARADRQNAAHPRQRHHQQLPLLRRPPHQVRPLHLPSTRISRACSAPLR